MPHIRVVVNKLIAQEKENEGKKGQAAELDLAAEDLRLMALQLKFLFKAEGSNVINAGDYGDKLYIIIDGTARVLIPNKGG